MSDANTVHPLQTPEPPYFRGVSFLAGGVGDLLYGSYGRSTNTMVVDATSVKKRSGYVRAFEETFVGSMQAVHHRESGINYTIAADGLGVKVLTALTAKKGGGNRYEHLSYPVDDFNRADGSGVGNASTGGEHYWAEAAQGHPSDSGTVYSGLAILSNQLKVPNNGAGSMDILIPNPSPFFVWRMELDLSSFDPGTSGNTGYGAHLAFGQGAPMNHIDADGQVVGYKWTMHNILAKHEQRFRPTSFVTGHTKDAPWMGLHWDVRLFKQGTDYKIEITQWHYFSSERGGENPTVERNGLRRIATRKTYTFTGLSSGDNPMQATHYLEIGRVQSAVNGALSTFNFWANRGRDGAPHSDTAIQGDRITSRIDSEHPNFPGFFYTIADPKGQYGHTSAWGRVESGATGDVFLDNMVVAGGFLA